MKLSDRQKRIFVLALAELEKEQVAKSNILTHTMPPPRDFNGFEISDLSQAIEAIEADELQLVTPQ